MYSKNSVYELIMYYYMVFNLFSFVQVFVHILNIFIIFRDYIYPQYFMFHVFFYNTYIINKLKMNNDILLLNLGN